MRKTRMISMAAVAALLLPGMILGGVMGPCAEFAPPVPHQCCRMAEEPAQSGHCGTGVAQSHPCSCSHLPATPADEGTAAAVPAVPARADAATTAAATPVHTGPDRPRFAGSLTLARGNPPPVHLIECSFLL